MKGYVHSTESFGTVDGPGVRFVVFLQGCPLRCLYCHNPDTWKPNQGQLMDVDEILEKYERNKAFLKNGGITCTGGEPLLQMDFVYQLFKKAKEKGIHTCLDTSGITFTEEKKQSFDQLMEVTDLVMLDIKHIEPRQHRLLTGQDNHRILAFATYLKSIQKPVWIRHVVVEGWTLNETYLYDLGYFIGGLDNLKALDVLPYHKMGNYKYESLNMNPPLLDTKEASKEDAEMAKQIILKGMKKRLKEKI
ncbi:MAG: pyruvate formate-lyase-activating protein [Erysipelotrichaceae bacterium]